MRTILMSLAALSNPNLGTPKTSHSEISHEWGTPSPQATDATEFGNCLKDVAKKVCWIHVIGDSIAQGVGTENGTSILDNSIADSASWPGQLRSLYAAYFNAPEAGCISPQFDGVDSRVKSVGSRAIASTGPMRTGVAITSESANGLPGSITYKVPDSSAIDILWYNGSPFPGYEPGDWFYSIDNAAPVIMSSSEYNYKTGYVMTTISGLPRRKHIVSLGVKHRGSMINFGVRYSSGRGVGVCRFAKAGWTILDSFGLHEQNRVAIKDSLAYKRLSLAYGAWNPELTIITFLHNDWGKQLISTGAHNSDVHTYSRFLEAATKSILEAGGDVMLFAPESPPKQRIQGEKFPIFAYRKAMRDISDRVPRTFMLDMNEIIGSPLDADKQGFFFDSPGSQTVHPSIKGHKLMASAVFSATVYSRSPR